MGNEAPAGERQMLQATMDERTSDCSPTGKAEFEKGVMLMIGQLSGTFLGPAVFGGG